MNIQKTFRLLASRRCVDRVLHRRAGRRISIVALLWPVLCPVLAVAQSVPPGDLGEAARRAEQLQREELLRQQQQFQNDRQSERPPTQIEIAPPPVTASPADSVCLPVERVSVEGVSLLPADEVDPVLRRYEQRCLGVADIERLLGEITMQYMTRGYITARAYLPAQDLTTGALRLQVIEGKVEQLVLEDGGRRSIRFGNVLPNVVGEPLNLRDFEQALDQLNRLASNNARFDLRPGSEAGNSIVVITNEPRRRWTPTLSYDNQGSESTGRDQLGVNLAVDRPLGLNDFISLTHRRAVPYDADRKASQSNSLTYMLPYGYSTFSLNVSQSTYDSAIAASSGGSLKTSGESNAGALRADYLAYRNQRARAGIYGNLARKSSKNYLEGTLIGVSSRTLSVADIGGTYSTALGGGALSLDLAYSRGLPILGALDDPGFLPSRAPRAQFDAFRLNASYLYPFTLVGQRWQWSSQFNGQLTPHSLYGSEQLLIGSLYTVRGFMRNTLSGDNGFYSRNDLSVSLPLDFGGLIPGLLRPYVALDYGQVSNRVSGVPEGDLAGAAAGLAYQSRHVRADVFYSHAVAKPDAMPSEGGVTYFRLSLNL
ncbi:MAG TPA: ShlB/FhaC/HecB family hemolysin secretion/activation protein [Solimonas sp.]